MEDLRQEPDSRASPWLRAFMQTAIFASLVVTAFVVLVDPYDSGRFNLLGLSGIVETRLEYLLASRGRDPQYESAILGNSHTELIDPVRLSGLSGRHFAQISLWGSLLVEQEALARWFIDHHAGRPGTLLFGIDEYWCAPPPLREGRPFPAWLYGGTLPYLANVVGLDGLTHAWRRVDMALGRLAPSQRDEFGDPEAGWVWQVDPVLHGRVDPRLHTEQDLGAPLPGVDIMEALISRAGPASRFVLLWTPVYVGALPSPGSDAARRWDECKQSFRNLADRHPNVIVMDWRLDGPIAGEVHNFWDRTHYRGNIARKIEDAVADVIASHSALR